jgi:hypothetical protein
MVWRPADGNETSAAYYMALTSKHTPSILALTRQNLPQLELSTIENGIKGGYVAVDTPNAAVTLISTGSEVSICIEAAEYLQKNHGIAARVVSVPCFEVFDAQDKAYRLQVLPDGIPVLSVEACSTMGWERYSHEQFGLNRFGASGPYKQVYEVCVLESLYIWHLILTFHRNSSSPPLVSPSALLPPLTSTRVTPCAPPSTVLSSRSCKERDMSKCFCFLVKVRQPLDTIFQDNRAMSITVHSRIYNCSCITVV